MPHSVSPRRTAFVLLAGLLAVAVMLFFRTGLQQTVMVRTALAEDSVTAELVEELLANAADPAGLVDRFWSVGKIPHRIALLRALARGGSAGETSAIPTWLGDAALDTDFQVRELALGMLVAHNPAQGEAFVRAALLDSDPELKELGLRHARNHGFTNLFADVAPLLDHPDPKVTVAAAQTLRAWSGHDFGVRMATLGLENGGDAATAEGIARWREWRDESTAPWNAAQPVAAAQRTGPLLPAPEFKLKTLEGETVQLSQFLGRPVLLNFWATWCSSCWPEIPELVALQERAGDRLVILGIALDGLPDQHALEHGHADGDHEDPDHSHAKDTSLAGLRELVGSFARSKKINYAILLDPTGEVSSLYQGNELPVNVVIDEEGRIQRRFIGGRIGPALDAMIMASQLP